MSTADQVLDLLGTFSTTAKDAADKESELYGQQAAIMAASSARNSAAADASEENALTAGYGMLAAQGAVQVTKQAYEFDVTDPNSRKRKAIEQFNKSYDTAQSMLDQIQSKKSISFLDDPLGFLEAQLSIDDDIAAYNLEATRGNLAFSAITSVDASLTASAQMEKATAKTLNTDSVKNDALIARAQFDQLASKAEYESIGSNINSLKAIVSGDKSVAEMAVKQFEILKSEQAMEIQKQHFELTKKNLALAMEAREDALAAKEVDKSLILKGMGLAKVQLPTDAAGKARFDALLKSPEGKKLYQTYYQLGLDASSQEMAGAPVRFGFSAGDVFYNEATTKGNFAGSEYKNQMEYINSLRNVAPPTLDRKNPEAVKAWVNAKVRDDMKQWSQNPEANLLTKAPIPAEVGMNPAVASTGFFKEVMAGSAAAKSLGPTPDEAMKAGLQAVAAGKMTLSDLSYGMQQYYETAVNLNSRRNYFAAIPPQDGYKAKITGTGVFKDSSYDLTKVEQINRAIADVIIKPFNKSGLGVPAFSILPGSSAQEILSTIPE